MTTWDTTVDLVIVGSGGGGMVAALAADDAGASALVLEKQELIGGSTCMSGGIAWVPNNPVMGADGVSPTPTRTPWPTSTPSWATWDRAPPSSDDTPSSRRGPR